MGVLVLTGLPQIVWREVFRRSPGHGWFSLFAFAMPMAVLALGPAWRPARELSAFSFALAVQVAGYWIAGQIVKRDLAGKLAPRARALRNLTATGAYKVVPALLLAAFLLLRGQGDRLFLRAGNIGGQVNILPAWLRISWMQFFGISVAGTAVFLILNTRRMKPAHSPDFRNVVRFAPIIIPAAVVNAFAEEFLYRNALLPFLVPAVGAHGAVWLTSLRYGLVHFYGTPSGVLGVAAATLFGGILGYSMLGTGGSAFAWTLHIIADLVIFGTAAAIWRPKRVERETQKAGEANLENVELG